MHGQTMVDHSQKWLSGGPLRHNDGQTMGDHDQIMAEVTMIKSWLTKVYPEQTIWTWFDHGGPCFHGLEYGQPWLNGHGLH